MKISTSLELCGKEMSDVILNQCGDSREGARYDRPVVFPDRWQTHAKVAHCLAKSAADGRLSGQSAAHPKKCLTSQAR